MRKKVLSAILSLGMLFGSIPCNTVSAETSDITVLRNKFAAMGISVEEMFSGSSITRGNFAELMVEFINGVTDDSGDYTRFVDVDTNHPSAPAINLLYERGFISGVGSYTFEPDRNITYAEALSVLVNALGYKIVADYAGGYLSGVLKAANDADLLDGISVDVTAEATKENIYKIIDNALEAEMMIAEFKGSDFEMSDSEMLALEYYHELYVAEGVVECNQYSSLSAPNEDEDTDLLIIDEVEYVASGDMQNWLGYEVKCYYRDDDYTYNAVFVQPTNRNETMSVDGDDVTEISEDTLTYENENGKSRKASLDDVKLIYNGIAYTGYGQMSQIDFTDTQITLLSNDSDSDYEILFITKYADFYVSNLDLKNEIVYDRKNNTNISLDSEEYSVLIYGEDGAAISFEEIAKDTVLSVAASPNTSGVVLKKAYVVNKTVTGTVTSYDEELGYQIGSEYYKKSTSCTLDLTLGETLTVSLGKTGAIVARTVNESEQTFGIYDRYFMHEDDPKKFDLKLFTADGEFVRYFVEDKVKVDGKSLKVTESLLSGTFSRGDALLFEVEDGQIKKIKKAVKTNSEPDDFKLVISGERLSVRGNLLAGVVMGDTKEIKVINLPTTLTKTDEWSLYRVGTDFEDLRYAKYEIYNFGETVIPRADVLIVKDMALADLDDEESKLFAVKSIVETIDDGAPAVQLKLINEAGVEQAYFLKDTLDTAEGDGYKYMGNEVEITKINGAELSDIAKGDIVRVGVAGDGRVAKIEKILDCTDRNDSASRLRPQKGLLDTAHYYQDSGGKYIDMGRIAYGTVGGYENNVMKFTTSIYPTIPDWANNTNVDYREELTQLKVEGKVIVYDRDDHTSRAITRDEINNYIGKECVLRTNQLVTGEVIIYE
ncbi:MAG: S-layer homology domain-containing protein [Clostridia bacterium]|nr:S-layer homology domain-containing protein [Clostridia bacterium]